MNCFEARQDFRSFWRTELAPEGRAAFNAHLGECAKCDSAFRIFALTAPVLHGEAEPTRPALARRSAAARSREVRSLRDTRASQWLSMAAVLALFLTGASAAYFSVETPPQTLSEAIHQPSPFVEMVSADMPEASSDLGQ
jgi:hypothetical protein